MSGKRGSARLRLVLVGAAAACALVASLSASAAFPGQNGKIVFGSQHAGEDEIWVMNADGSGRHNLTRHDGAKVSDIDPRWSPDGRKIVFASDRGGSMQIWVMNANGSEPTRLTSLPGRNRYPAFTADGKQIVFQSNVAGNFEIYRMNADGAGATNLTSDPGVDWSPATSPRGKKIAFTRERGEAGHLYVWSPDEPLKQVTSTEGYDYLANWSPSGNDLVFTRSEGGEDEIYVAHADGTGESQLTDTPGVTEYFPAFSPDGNRITYLACVPPPIPAAPNPDCSVHTMNRDGTGDTDLAFPTPPTSLPFTDDFSASTRTVDRWAVLHDGTGGFYDQRSGRVELTLTEDATPSSGQYPQINVRYEFACVLTGDFDAQVDYELLDWPEKNGAIAQLHAAFVNATAGRQSNGDWGEWYAASVAPSSWSAGSTQDVSGRLRLQREGELITSSYWNGSSWTDLLSVSGSDGPTLILLELASQQSPSDDISVAFDNFRLDAEEEDVDCSHYRPDWHPDWQPLGK